MAQKPAEKMIRALRSERDYEAALRAIEPYFEDEPKAGTTEADRFDLLALVIEDYERKRWPIDPPDPVDALHWRMETGGFTQADLGRVVGSRQRASDILRRRRGLTMQMAWKLRPRLGHPRGGLATAATARVTREKPRRAVADRGWARYRTAAITCG